MKHRRHELWLLVLDEWCERHGITRHQGLSILQENRGKENKVVMNDLLDWAESNDFIWEEVMKKKNPAAVALGKLGGKARTGKMTRAERVKLAQKAAEARWGKKR